MTYTIVLNQQVFTIGGSEYTRLCLTDEGTKIYDGKELIAIVPKEALIMNKKNHDFIGVSIKGSDLAMLYDKEYKREKDHVKHSPLMQIAKLHSKGGRLYLKPIEILTSEKGRYIMKRIKESNVYKRVKEP